MKLKDLITENKDTYFNTFSQAVQFARKEAEKKGYEIDEYSWGTEITHGKGRPRHGSTVKFSVELTKQGKPVKKTLNIQVHDRGDVGNPYELNFYIQ